MINLKQFIDQDVTVTFENGNTYEGTIVISDDKVYPYAFMVNGERLWAYTYDGYVWYDKCYSHANIKSIKVKETSIQHQLNQIQQQLNEIQKQVNRDSKIDEILSSLNSIEKKSLFIRLRDELM